MNTKLTSRSYDASAPLVSMASALRLTTYRKLKDKFLGSVASTERTQFERELAQELTVLAAKKARKPKTPRA
jgi:hypothetical protein